MSGKASVDPSVRMRILDAAAAEFTRRGFAKTTIDDIARAVGATKGLIYYYFSSKFDIFLGGYEQGMHAVKEAVEPLADSAGSGLERLNSMATAHVVNLMKNANYHHLIHQGVRDQSSESLTVRQRDALMDLNQLRKDYEMMFREVVQTGISDGSLRTVDPGLCARVLLSNLNAVDMWYREQGSQDDHEIRGMAAEIVDFVINGVSAR